MQNMMIYSAKWNEKPSFRLMPVSDNCPFNEAIFDPEQKVLAVISKDNKDKPMMMPRLNDRGDLIATKRANGEQGWQEQRVVIPAYYEYYLEDINDIVKFVQMFAINASTSTLFSDVLHSSFELGSSPIAEEKAEEIKKVKRSK